MAEEAPAARAGRDWHIEGLAAAAPEPSLRGPRMLFGQFVGDWEITEFRFLEDDGSWSRGRGKVHGDRILDGRALQDVWTSIDEATGRSVPIGTTIRFYDAERALRQSVWISPSQGVVRPFVGRPVGSEIVLEGKNAEDRPIRWIFYEITPTAFRWRGEELRAPPDGWVLYEEMWVRRPPGAAAGSGEGTR